MLPEPTTAPRVALGDIGFMKAAFGLRFAFFAFFFAIYFSPLTFAEISIPGSRRLQRWTRRCRFPEGVSKTFRGKTSGFPSGAAFRTLKSRHEHRRSAPGIHARRPLGIRCRSRSYASIRALVRGCAERGAAAAQCHDARHRRLERQAERPGGAPEGRGWRRLRLLHELQQP